jgi:hypothetical protein
MKVHFDDLFSIQNGMVTPKVQIHINGVNMGPGASFGSDVAFGGVELAKLVGQYLDVDVQNGIHIINGIYN